MKNLNPEDNWDQLWSDYALRAAINPAQLMRFNWLESKLKAQYIHAEQVILDVGCGTGDLLVRLGKTYETRQLFGVDYSPVGVEIAKKKLPGLIARPLDLIKNVAALLDGERAASFVTCSEVLEHVDAPSLLMKNV